MAISKIPRTDVNVKDMENISHPFMEHILQIVGDMLSTNWIMLIISDTKNPDTIFTIQKQFGKSGVGWQFKGEKLGIPLAKKIIYQLSPNQNHNQHFIIRPGDKSWSKIEPVLKDTPYISEQMRNKYFSPCMVICPEKFNEPKLSLVIINELQPDTLLANPDHCLQISNIFDMAIAYEHERYEEEKKLILRTAQLKGLHDISMKLTLEYDQKRLVEAIVRQAMSLTHADRGAFYLFRQEIKLLELLYKVGPFPDRVFLNKGEGLSGKVWKTGKPLLVPNYKTWPGRAHEFDNMDIGASLAVPVRWGNEFLGVITNDSDIVNFFSKRDVEMVELFAPQAAVAVINTRLVSEIQNLNRFNESILQNLGGGIVKFDSKITISYLNQEMEELIGYSFDEMKGKNWREIIPLDWVERVGSEIETCLSNGESRFFAEIINKNKEKVNVIVHFNQLIENNQKVGIIGLFLHFEDSFNHLTSDLHERVNFLHIEIINHGIDIIKKLLHKKRYDELEDRIQILDKACWNLHSGLYNMMTDLRIPILAKEGLGPAIKKYYEILPGNEYKFSVVDKSQTRFKSQIELSLFRIAQGAIQNAIKNAELDKFTGFVEVILEKTKTRFTMIIEDNGKGFNADHINDNDRPISFGLLEMKQWAKNIPDARFQITSKYNENRCTKVIVSFPLGASG